MQEEECPACSPAAQDGGSLPSRCCLGEGGRRRSGPWRSSRPASSGVLLVGLAVLLAGWGGDAAAAPTCIKRAGDYQVDLGPLMDSEFALTYKDPLSGDRSYLATVCGSAKIFKGCGTRVDDVVATAASSCEYYGRLSREQPLELIDASQPDRGVKVVTYGGGGKCVDPIQQTYSVAFVFECDRHGPEHMSPQAALVGVASTSTCHYEYRFRSKAACPVYSPAGGKGGAGGGASGHVVALVVVVVVLCAYCLAGSAYKSRVLGASGLEMVPHIDCLRRLVLALRAGLLGLMGAASGGLGRGGGGASRYKGGHKYAQTNPTGSFGAQPLGGDDVEVIDFDDRGGGASSLLAGHHHRSSGGHSSNGYDDGEEDDVKL